MLSMLAIVCSGWGFLGFFWVLKSAKYVFLKKILPRKMQNVYCRKKLSNIPYTDNVKKF